MLVAGGQAIDLTEDHKPDSPAERARITGAGGHVSKADPATGAVARVWLDESQEAPGLAVARSIGDHVASRVGVFAEPEVRRLGTTIPLRVAHTPQRSPRERM